MLALAIRFLLPILLRELVASGVMSKAESITIKGISDLVLWIKDLQVVRTYPENGKDETHNFNRQPS